MKILVSDFDNTFYTKDIKENVKLVNDFIKKGNIFVIATGRPLYLIKPDIEKYNIKYDYLICNDGGVIFDSNEKILDKTNIDYKTTIQVYNELVRNSNLEHLFIDSIFDFSDLEAKDYNGILASPYDRDKANELISQINKKYPTVQAYLSHKWINILSINASKGNAIEFLENSNEWDKDNIFIAGDNNNDLSMTRYKNSFGMLNGKSEFLDKCTYKVNNFKEIFEIINKK